MRDPEVERAGLVQVLASDPRAWALPQAPSRWTLGALRAGLPSFWQYSLSGVWRILAKHRLRRRRGCDHLRSPDPAYHEKLAEVARRPDRRIYLVQDNWPVHFHPDVLAALEPQTSPFPFLTPPSWSTEPGPNAKRLKLPIQLVPLPTYAPWTNPIEKLWRWLKQDVLHLHRLADDLPALRLLILDFLHSFEDGSSDLLHYVGLALPT